MLSTLALAISSTGCATMRRGAAAVLLPIDQEIALGAQFSEEIEKDLRLHPNAAVQTYIANLGARVVAAAGSDRHRSMSFTFKVVDDPDTINAFALPGGWIYIYSGLLLAAESEAEVVSVLAHEVAHVTRRHIAERLATAYGIQALTAVALGQDPGMASQIAAAVAGTGYLLRFSREQEVDADVVGVGYTVKAGWQPDAFVTFFQRLGGDRQAGSRRALGWISTHPMPEDRIVHVRRAIESHRNVPTRLGAAEHQRLVAMLGASGTAAPSSTPPTGVGVQPGTRSPRQGISPDRAPAQESQPSSTQRRRR